MLSSDSSSKTRRVKESAKDCQHELIHGVVATEMAYDM